MAGILANSASKQMVSGDSAVSQTVTGYVSGEQITLSVTPTASSWTWSMALPSGSSPAKSALSDDEASSPTFTPDVGGIYTVTFASGSTSYTLGITVVAPSVSVPVNALTLLPLADAQVATPTSGQKFYYSTTQSAVASKNTSGTVSTFLTSASGEPLATAHIARTDNPHSVTAAQAGAATTAALTNHTGNTSNPHSVTAAQVGAPTTSDLTNHTGNTSNPHSVTAAQAGAPTTSDLTNHTGNTSNPHSVTAAQTSALPLSGGTMTGAINVGGYALSNFKSGGSASDVTLSSDGATAIATWTVTGLGASKRFIATLGARVQVWSAAQEGVIDCVVDIVVTTDSGGTASLALNTTPVPDVTRLPGGFEPIMTITVATNVLTINIARVESTLCKANAQYWFNEIRELAAVS